MTTRHVALVSTAEFAHLDEDLPLLTAAIEEAGVDVRVVDWHDERLDWSAFDLVVLRSPWDYTWQLEGFLAWARHVASCTRLANPFDVVAWNTDKRYLTDLRSRGVPVVPTTVLEPGGAWPERFPEGDLVVKPVVSAGSRDTERYEPERLDQARSHASALLDQGRAVLVQPYLHAIDDEGETGLVFVGDVFSHAFRKGPILAGDAAFVEGLYREEEVTPRAPSGAERAVAESVLDAVAACVPGSHRADLLYARVDLAPGPDGPLLLELELVEPSLFCAVAPGSAGRVARVVAEVLA